MLDDSRRARPRVAGDARAGVVALPERARSPWWELGRRLLMALGILVGTVLLVYFDRDGYSDGNDPPPTTRSTSSTRSTTRPSR